MKKQSGFSFVELMIAITLGLVVLAAVLEFFMGNRRSYQYSAAVSELSASKQFLQSHVHSIIRMSAYRSLPSGSYTSFPSIDSVYPVSTPFVTGTNNDGENNSDTLTVRFQGSGNGSGTPDGRIVDCLNNGVDSGDMATNTFYLNNAQQLVCDVTNETSGTTQSGILVDGVENFQFIVGEDLDGDFIPDRYVPIDYLNIDVANITSVRLSVLFQTDAEVTRMEQSRDFNLLGTAYTSASDRRFRFEDTSTIQLRNLAYDAI